MRGKASVLYLLAVGIPACDSDNTLGQQGDGEPTVDMTGAKDAGVDAPADAPRSDGGCGCGEILDPVCGADGTTYDNACLAQCAGVLLACEGNCQCPGCGCPEIYDPVCGTDGMTYGNTCEAECVNAIISCDGTCPCEEPCDPGAPATCPSGYECFCGSPGGMVTCQCGLTCETSADCSNLNQTECCNDSVCTDPCTCDCD